MSKSVLVRKDYVRISNSGFFFKNHILITQCDFNNEEIMRIGFTASKRVGNAVMRNRCKRRLRVASKIILDEHGLPGIDYVFIARKIVAEISWLSLLESVKTSVLFLNRKVLKCKK